MNWSEDSLVENKVEQIQGGLCKSTLDTIL